MRYLFVTGHPAHVHLFKNVIRALEASGNEILVGAVTREMTTDLLKLFGIPYLVFGHTRPEMIGKALGVLPKELALLKLARDFNPDVFISTGSPYAAHVSAVLDKPHLAFGDTEDATLISRLMIPFTNVVCTPACYEGDLGPKQVRYNGYKELAYLHPTYFRPNRNVIDIAGLSSTEPYIIMRLASWDASHDLGGYGFGFKDSHEALTFVKELESSGRVVVTSDRKVGPPLDSFGLSISPELIHHVLAFAKLYIGEGATMAAEAGVLGVPWIFVSNRGRGFLSDQQNRYRLGYWVPSAEIALERARMLLSQGDLPEEWRRKRDFMLSEKADVTRFITEFIEGWPDSSVSAMERQVTPYAESAFLRK